jgi:mRNA interferase MazF
MAFRRGDVILVPFPFSDQQTSKVRPALVVSSSDYHAEEPDLLPAAIPSQLRAVTGPLDYILSDWQGAGLRFPSAFRPVLVTIAPARVLHTVGTLAAADLAAIDDCLRRALGL